MDGKGEMRLKSGCEGDEEGIWRNGRGGYSEWIRIISSIIMNSPPIRHNNRILRNKKSIIPIILNNIMIIPKFINRSPSQEFLFTISILQNSWEYLDYSSHIREIRFVVKIGSPI